MSKELHRGSTSQSWPLQSDLNVGLHNKRGSTALICLMQCFTTRTWPFSLSCLYHTAWNRPLLTQTTTSQHYKCSKEEQHYKCMHILYTIHVEGAPTWSVQTWNQNQKYCAVVWLCDASAYHEQFLVLTVPIKTSLLHRTFSTEVYVQREQTGGLCGGGCTDYEMVVHAY